MSKKQFYLRAILKWLIAILAAANLVALFVFNYNVPGVSQLFSRASSAISGQSSGSSGDSGSDASAIAPAESDDSEKEDTSDEESGIEGTDTESESSLSAAVSNTTGTDSGEPETTSGETEAESAGDTRSDAEGTGDSGDSDISEASGGSDISEPVITVSDDLPTFKTSELSLIVDLLIDQNLLQADDGYGNDATYDVTGEISEGSSDGEYTLTLSLTNEEGGSTSVEVTIQTSD